MEFETENEVGITDEQRALAQTRAKNIEPLDPFLALAPSQSLSDGDQHAVLALDNETTVGQSQDPFSHEHTGSAGQQLVISIAGILGVLITIAGIATVL